MHSITNYRLMNNTKSLFCLTFSLLALTITGCTTVKYYPANFVESLQHPTKFPEVFSSNVKNIEEVADKNPLGENEEVKITDVGENKNSSMHLLQIREGAALPPHYHKRHDEVIYVKKGSGIATLDDTRYLVKPGSILQIPSKTVHKFLNTGAEPFVAVSIFSPPFDGRDEKIIKEKKKAPRDVKEEKRLAAKKTEKPEKITEKNQAAEVKELTDEEVQTTVNKSTKVAEKSSGQPVHEELDSDTVKSSSSPKTVSPPAGKKKKKGVTPHEASAVNVEDLHEKLTKLVELKEEGAISAEDYEEKKDALVSGKDIGELPEPKSPVKKVMPTDQEDEPISMPVKKQVLVDKDIPEKKQNMTPNAPGVFDKTEPSTHEVVSEEKESSGDKLEALEELKQEGLITEEDYESKKRELDSVSLGKSTIGTPTNATEDERIRELKELHDQGLITKDDYQYKLKELSDSETKSHFSDNPSEKEDENDKLSELNELKEEGLISEEDYEFKKAELLGNKAHTP